MITLKQSEFRSIHKRIMRYLPNNKIILIRVFKYLGTVSRCFEIYTTKKVYATNVLMISLKNECIRFPKSVFLSQTCFLQLCTFIRTWNQVCEMSRCLSQQNKMDRT